MQSLIVFFQLGGAVALLLFGLRMIREGVTEAFGMRLKMALGLGTQTGPRAFLSGLVATLGLQSSTATALMTASFVERGMIRPRMAQIALLGANVGTALTAWLVATGIEQIAPGLILAGYVMARRKGPVWAGSGQALTGIGLMLLSLTLLSHATEPLRGSAAMAAFLGMLDSAWPVAFAFAAAIAALCASSLAAVMLVLSLALPPGLTVVLVLGANLGGALPPVLVSARSGLAARRVTTGNLVVRGIGCLVALPFAGLAGQALTGLTVAGVPLPGALAVQVHLAFNLLLAALIWPLSGAISDRVARLLPEEEKTSDAAPRWLDEDALENPPLALAGAAREALAIGDMITRMLVQTRTAFGSNDSAPLAEVAVLENRIDRRQQEVKTYLSRLGREAGAQEKQRSIVILDYVINLEHMGDIIDKGLAPEVHKKVGLGLRFSDEGYRELDTMFVTTLEALRMAQTVFMTRDRDLARRLMEVKVEVRKLERQSAQRHLIRLRDGQPDSRETSSLHLDMLRDLKRITAHIVSVAHPILDDEGLLIESRLKTG